MKMLAKVIGYSKDRRFSEYKFLEKRAGRLYAGTLPYLRPFARELGFQFTQEFFYVLKIPVYRSKPHISDLVQRPKALH